MFWFSCGAHEASSGPVFRTGLPILTPLKVHAMRSRRAELQPRCGVLARVWAHKTSSKGTRAKDISMAAEGGTSWDDMLDAAVLQGLAPDRVPTGHADDGEDAGGAAGAHDAEGDLDELHVDDDLDELHDSLTREVSASLQAATGRAVMLLRRDPSSAELQENPNPSPSPSPSLSPSPSPNPNH
jgi:hypothetical protein